MINIRNSVCRLEKYIESKDYRGYDPYDGLMSPIFSIPILITKPKVRFVIQQIVKRLPINVRSILHIKKGLNPVTIGLCIQGYSYLMKIYPDKSFIYSKKIDYLMNILVELSSRGYSGLCWGYDFDWESRYISLPAYTPTIVATGFITNSLFEFYNITGNKTAKDMIIDSGRFILNDLNKKFFGNTFCYSYSPLDNQIVFNATMKGARLLSQVYSITKNTDLKVEAEKTVKFVMSYQKNDGSWIYSEGDERNWVDNFHTAYILDCLFSYINLTKDEKYNKYLYLGTNYYFNNLFNENYLPKYYNNSLYPIDSTSAAQSIITACRFGNIDLAINIAKWMIDNMQAVEGYFYYQKNRLIKNKIPYMRWSNAWMFVALAYLLFRMDFE